MSKLTFMCPCHFGLESVLNYEVKKIGGENIVVTDGKVSFSGDFKTMARANICLSTAERVLIVLGQFNSYSFEDLFQGVKALPLEDFIAKNDAFPNKGYCLDSQLNSVRDCQSIIKKACVERLKSVYNTDWFEEDGARIQLQFSIHKNLATIYLDTTGTGLHKRGYRQTSNLAPIKETLAAGIIDLARIRENTVVQDPFCGSGTILIESAFKALSVAPGLRRKFLSESWGCVPNNLFSEIRQEEIAKINKTGQFIAYGSDIDDYCVDLTISNAKKAGVVSKISTTIEDIKNFTPIPNSTIICNPPYGERMLELKEAEKLYRIMGERFNPSQSNPCYIISPHEEFEKFFGKQADKRRKLYNGMIKCQLFMYFK